MTEIDVKLQDALDWTKESLQDDLPPWAWYNYMKLQEALRAVIDGRNCVIEIEEDQGDNIVSIGSPAVKINLPT